MRSRSSFVASLSLCAVLAAALVFTRPAAAQPASSAHGLVGRPAPAFALMDFQHHIIRLSQYRGKVVLLNFWASWCAPCQAEMPAFAQWQSQYRGRLQVIGVNMDDQLPKAEAVARRIKVNYPLVTGTYQMGNTYGGIDGLPVTFVMDARGRIRAEYNGGDHVKEIRAEIARLMAHPAR